MESTGGFWFTVTRGNRTSRFSHLQQLLLLTLPLSHVLVQGDGDPLGVGAAAAAHAQLRQLVAHGAVEGGEVLRDGSLPPGLLSARRGRARRLLDLRAEKRHIAAVTIGRSLLETLKIKELCSDSHLSSPPAGGVCVLSEEKLQFDHHDRSFFLSILCSLLKHITEEN